VAKSPAAHLRIRRADDDDSTAIESGDAERWRRLCNRFEQATGWPLRYVTDPTAETPAHPIWSAPLNLGTADAAQLVIPSRPSKGAPPKTSADAVTALADALAEVLTELGGCRQALLAREAELAAGVPVISRGEDAAQLAERLVAVLQGGATAVDCQAAGVYLLDPATTELKLRSCWGLPAERLLAEARPLRGALADLEALAGSAVVLDTPTTLELWHAPENFGSAVCVPVSSATSILGTLWMFSCQQRDFSDQQTNLIEIIAGRVAIELEREALLGEGTLSVDVHRQLAAASQLQQDQLPESPPIVEGAEVHGWTEQASDLGGAFHDWFVLAIDAANDVTASKNSPSDDEIESSDVPSKTAPTDEARSDDMLAVALSSGTVRGTAAALTAQTVRTALREHALCDTDPATWLDAANRTLWHGSAGDQFASAFAATLEGRSGMLHYAAAGNVEGLIVRDGANERLTRPRPTLGADLDISGPSTATRLDVGDLLVAWCWTADEEPAGSDELADRYEQIGKLLLLRRGDSCEQIARAVRQLLQPTWCDVAADASLVVLRRMSGPVESNRHKP